jgi:hypothetical protein
MISSNVPAFFFPCIVQEGLSGLLYTLSITFLFFEAPELASKEFAPDLVVRGSGVERAAEICAFRMRQNFKMQ